MLPFALALVQAAPAVSVDSLFPQMTDLSYLTRRPEPAYTMAQASSYDPAAYTGDPFANGDAGKFVRVEDRAGRKEYVLCDLKGPGAAVRVWSANPSGVIRFYFDGEATPRIEAKMVDLMTGKVSPFFDPFAYGAAQGVDLYFPLPYAKSLKVTVDDSDGDAVKGLYYHVGYRTYAPGTRVVTYTKEQALRSAAMRRAATDLNKIGAPNVKMAANPMRIPPGGQAGYVHDVKLSSAIKTLVVKIPFPLVVNIRAMDWSDPFQPHNVLRSLILKMTFDGEETVRAPLGDFFGTAPGLNPHRTLPFEVREDGTMICRYPMPFQRSVKLSIENTGAVEVPVYLGVEEGFFPWTKDTYLFHAQWQSEKERTRPMRDLTFLDVKGEGMFVGSNLQITNPSPQWWGEGDEKFYVDGEARPSTFGTGTEDYYGYAWCSPILFSRPYHAQPRCDGPGNMGQTNVQRWHVFDPVPFRKSFKFDMEKWHWDDVEATWARTTYWYAKPKTTGPLAVDRTKLLPEYVAKPEPVKGAIEGEDMELVSVSGGELSVQDGFWQPSGGKQRWWVDPKVGDKLVLKVPVEKAGTYNLTGSFCFAGDYGIHRLRLNGQDLGTHDFFGDLAWKKLDLGRVTLPAGTASLEVECIGANEKAQPRRMFGLDYLLLTPR